MALVSMTGFARAEGGDATYGWAWEAKSVNSKALDIRCRLPAGFDRLEVPARRAAEGQFKRGNLALTLTVNGDAAPTSYRVNRDLLAHVVALRAELGDQVAATPPRLEGLLAIRGMIEPIEATEDRGTVEARDAAMLDTLGTALTALTAARADEGARLDPTVGALLDEIGGQIDAARNSAAAQPQTVAERLRAMIEDLVAAADGAGGKIPPERLAQEAALAVGRADVREELDRLAAHLASARALVAAHEPVGRRLDFLCQELNREANTVCSKAADLELHGAGLALKAAIEQLREQIQNIE